MENPHGDLMNLDDMIRHLFSRNDCRLRMVETHEGIVDHVQGDRLVVVYDVNGDVVEQEYEKDQFLDGLLPDEGTRLVVLVAVAEIDHKSDEIFPVLTSSDESPDCQRESITGPVEF